MIASYQSCCQHINTINSNDEDIKSLELARHISVCDADRGGETAGDGQSVCDRGGG